MTLILAAAGLNSSPIARYRFHIGTSTEPSRFLNEARHLVCMPLFVPYKSIRLRKRRHPCHPDASDCAVMITAALKATNDATRYEVEVCQAPIHLPVGQHSSQGFAPLLPPRSTCRLLGCVCCSRAGFFYCRSGSFRGSNYIGKRQHLRGLCWVCPEGEHAIGLQSTSSYVDVGVLPQTSLQQ